MKELSMEKTLSELEKTWSGMHFVYEKHTRTGTFVVRVDEVVIEALEDNQVSVRILHSLLCLSFILTLILILFLILILNSLFHSHSHSHSHSFSLSFTVMFRFKCRT